jgi:DNA-binding CsgD family transcriptional regulator
MPEEQPGVTGQFTDGAVAFLSFLCANPSGDDVALAVVHGPLRTLGATASAVYQAPDPQELSLIGAFGMPDVTWQKYSSISVAAPLTTCRTFRENRLIVRSGESSGSWFAEDERRILQAAIRTPEGRAPVIITVPLAVKGLPIGVLCVHTPPRGELTTAEDQQLRGTAGALALWLYMHQVSEHSRARHPLPEPSPHVRITDRQVRILELVAEGRPAREIGATLQYSESTVKKDLMRLMSFLNVRDREAAIARAREIGLLPS